MTADAIAPATLVLDVVEVRSVERLSPTFLRVELGGAALADVGVDGPSYDQRIKLVFPGPSGVLPPVERLGSGWYAARQALPEAERGHVRTYTIRALRGAGEDTRLVVDFVLHLAPGAIGPASTWAAGAVPGDRLVVLAPRRGVPFGGIEFDPGPATEVLIAADETAVPAVSSILEQWPAGLAGTAYLEIPERADVLDLPLPPGVEVVWLPRIGAAYGDRLVPAVRAHVGLPATADLVAEAAVDPDLWETPTWFSSGEAVPDEPAVPDEGLYAWIAGESRVVTSLRRTLVRELGIDRRRVAFMGYWREGVAMRS